MYDDAPDFAKPTISKKVKNHELSRIADEKTKTDKAKMMITDHNDFLRTERLDPNRYTKKKNGFGDAKHTQMASAKALSQMKKKKQRTPMKINEGEEEYNEHEEDVKHVQVKTANKSIRVMKQEAAIKRDPTQLAVADLDDSDDMKLDTVLSDILCNNLTVKMSKGDPEYKLFKENYDRVIPYFVERFTNIPEEVHFEIFSEFNDRLEEFIAILGKNLYEFCDLSRFLADCLI